MKKEIIVIGCGPVNPLTRAIMMLAEAGPHQIIAIEKPQQLPINAPEPFIIKNYHIPTLPGAFTPNNRREKRKKAKQLKRKKR